MMLYARTHVKQHNFVHIDVVYRTFKMSMNFWKVLESVHMKGVHHYLYMHERPHTKHNYIVSDLRLKLSINIKIIKPRTTNHCRKQRREKIAFFIRYTVDELDIIGA